MGIELFEHNKTAYESAAAMLAKARANSQTLSLRLLNRKRYADGKLNEKQIAKLSEIGVELN